MHEEQTNDDALMQAYAAGDQDAFAQLYGRWRGPLFRYYRRHLGPAETEDCFQTLWLKIIDHAPRYRSQGAFAAFAFTLAHNVLMDHYRRHRRLAEVALEEEDAVATAAADTAPESVAAGAPHTALVDGAATPEDDAGEAQLRRRFLALLEALPFHQREAWVLKQESGMTVAEIAAVTGTSIEGVRSRLRYAIQKLKAGLSRHV